MNFHFTAKLCLLVSFLLFFSMPSKNLLAQQGTSCNNPLVYNGNNLFYSGTTCGAGDNIAIGGSSIIQTVCNSQFIAGEDLLFLFTPSETACYNIEINGDEGISFSMYTACPNNISNFSQVGNCLDFFGTVGNFGNGIATNQVSVSLADTISYFLVVSSYNGTLGNFPCGDFDISVSLSDGVANDFCSGALPLTNTGNNYEATDCGEPDDWTPTACAAEWSSNENGVWYTFSNPIARDITFNVYDIQCQGGGGTLQIGIWTNNNTCDLSLETAIGCLVTNENESIILPNFPAGDYYLFVDGDAGANCSWNFGGTLICDTYSPDLCDNCEQPSNAIATNITCSSVRLQWDAVLNATAYQIAGRKVGGTWKIFAEQTDNFREFTNGVLPNTTYEWTVRAICANTPTDWMMPTMSFSTPACKNGETNSYDIFADVQKIRNEISLYPNPAKDVVQLAYKINGLESLRTTETLQLQIIDITGKVVLQKILAATNTDNLFRLDISQLKKGQYFVSIKNENIQMIDKFIVL